MIRRLLVILTMLAGCGDDAAPARDAGPDAAAIDARLAPCGLAPPGSTCASSFELDRCEGTKLVSVTCDAGLVCGSEPSTGAGATCVHEGDACGVIGREGACSGTILTRCDNQKLETIDCAQLFGTCSTILGRCSHACESASVSAVGRCVRGALVRCVFDDGVYRVDTTTCPAGTVCDDDPDTGYPTCLPAPACADLDGQGACDGDTLRRCVDGQPQVTDCAASGEVCVWGGEALGHICAARATSGALRVTGAVRYEDREQHLRGYGTPTPRPVRGAAVTVVDDRSGRTLGAGVTDDDGRYELRFDATEGTAVHILAIAAVPGKLRPARVLRPDGLLHGFAGASFAAGLTGATDLLVTERSGEAEAFNILDQLVTALDAVRVQLDVAEPVPITGVWVKGSDQGSFALGTTLVLLGSIGDDDGYDDAVIQHEIGHYVEHAYGRSDNPGGTHIVRTPARPSQAWSEGFATYFGSVVRGDPQYIDTVALGGIRFNIDEDVTPARGDLPQTQDITENTVSEILWDLGDGGPMDDDPAPGPQAQVLRVEPMFLRPLAGDTRGFRGVDLVDFLDGFLFLAGPSACAPTRAILGTRFFPYDFAGPLTCP